MLKRMKRLMDKKDQQVGDYNQLQAKLDDDSTIQLDDLVSVSGGTAAGETTTPNM